ncbi:acetyltransferase [Paraburkholderia diazotrophica]|uniref:Sugar O-acyltransferase, sialic acid O-acetyltransferase NeuD family n=1 Tax=Paraburkholderia diazotrophica TaxID=667676 RepID=A0A1H7DRA0_9BURK|nr:acetyltransferase [Paraburkholderia diazotrophica]SEK02182.1 sugar O-acyltransferase, sialic acid O-acetyltransferase NeuD family [Paraburkholderia diazotrophica]
MEKTRKLVILGDSAFAEIAYEYFTHDSSYQVVGFSVEQAFLKRDELFGLPVVPFESIDAHFSPTEHFFFAAITYVQLNRLRTRLYKAAKDLGYQPASYVSSRAFVWRNAELGEHCFIFEGNVVQPFVRIGDNVVLWSGNHIGHHSVIGANCFVASHAVVSGFVNMGENCFVGVNTTFSNNIVVGKDCLIGAGAVVARDVPEDKVVKGEAGEPTGSARRLNRVKE